MRKTPLALSTVFMAASLFIPYWASGAENSGPPVNKHRQSIDNASPIILSKDRNALAEIVIGDTPCQVVRFAAWELKETLDKITGADFKIVSRRGQSASGIFLGNCETAEKLGVNVKSLPRDSFVIKSSGGDILIAGRDDKNADPLKGMYLWGMLYEKGTLFGVYEFLERFAGARFFFPGKYGVVTPKTPSLSVPCMDIYEEPDCLIRRVAIHPEETGRLVWYEEQSPKELLWTYTLINLRGRMQTLYVPNDHGLAARGYIKRFGKNHPEYFALRADGTRSANPDEPHPGHLCYSSEGLRREIFLDAKAYLTGERAKTRGVYEGKSDKFGWNISNTAPGYFDIMPQDALGEGNWCHCEKCWPYWKEGRQSELIWGMVSDIAGRLKKEGVAGNVTCSPYACYRALPEFSLPENIYGSLCVTGPWGEAAPEFQAKDEKLVVEWGNKLNKKLELRNYMNDYGGGIPKGVPPVSPHMVAKYWKKTAPLVNGAYTQANISYGLFNQFPNAYVLYKCLWNSRLDADELMADAMLKLFGPAAGPMGKFFSRLEEIWARSFAGFIIETPLGPMLARRTDREVWDTIFTPDVFKEFDALFDEAERLAVNDTDAKMRVEFFREKYFGEMRRVRDAYYNLKREIDDLVMIVPPVPGQVVVDGKLDDPAWKECEPVYLTPADGKDPKVKTAVRALWSADTLYIAFDCEEPRTDAMTLLERKSDDRDLWQNSSVEVFLNPSQDREKYYHFTVDANGVFSDSLVNAKGGFHRSKIDLGWNCGLAVKTVIGRDRWTAEIAIPIKALKPDSVKPEEMWVANFTRSRHLGLAGKDENQYMSWSPFLRGDNFHDIQRFGRIQFEGKADDKSGQQPADGSFEGKISGRMLGAWYLPVDERKRALIHTDGSTYRDGCQSVCLACESAKAEDSLSISQKLPRLKPDTDYLLTFWIKADGVSKSTSKYSGAMVNIIWTGGNYNEFWPLNGYWGTFGWTKQAVRFRTPKSGDTDVKNGEAWLSLRLNNASGKVWFDDVRIRETVAAPCPQ